MDESGSMMNEKPGHGGKRNILFYVALLIPWQDSNCGGSKSVKKRDSFVFLCCICAGFPIIQILPEPREILFDFWDYGATDCSGVEQLITDGQPRRCKLNLDTSTPGTSLVSLEKSLPRGIPPRTQTWQGTGAVVRPS